MILPSSSLIVDHKDLFDVISSGPYDRGCAVVAVNAKKLCLADADKTVSRLIGSSYLYCDGVLGSIYFRVVHGERWSRIRGCELWLKLLDFLSETSNQRVVYILGSKKTILDRAEIKLRKRFPNLKIEFRDGFSLNDSEIVQQIKELRAGYVFFALGSPKQERLIQYSLDQGVKACMLGIGGSIDLLVNPRLDAPLIFKKLGLEWCYRYFLMPSRVFREYTLLKAIPKIILDSYKVKNSDL